MKDNLIQNLSHKFAVNIVKFCLYLNDTKKFYALTSQLVRSGTSIGSNICEAQDAQSYADFISKMNISLKEANETCFWLEILFESGFIEEKHYKQLYPQARELKRILSSIIKTSKERNNSVREESSYCIINFDFII